MPDTRQSRLHELTVPQRRILLAAYAQHLQLPLPTGLDRYVESVAFLSLDVVFGRVTL